MTFNAQPCPFEPHVLLSFSKLWVRTVLTLGAVLLTRKTALATPLYHDLKILLHHRRLHRKAKSLYEQARQSVFRREALIPYQSSLAIPAVIVLIGPNIFKSAP
ncbi:hypothetical protein FRC03_012076 [Tulasnella sp. 419]|nr:hypothetical protein FRC03_012076 [Tulasnella sp. 419]